MKIIEKLQRSFRLFQSSVRVIQHNPKLLLFPALIGVFTLAMGLFFLLPIVLYPTGHAVTQAEHWQALGNKAFTLTGELAPGQRNQERRQALGNKAFNQQPESAASSPSTVQLKPGPLILAYGALVYLASMFLATFCNVAFNSEVLAALNGDRVSIRHGIQVAWSRLKSILVWSLFAGLVGILIKEIESRLSFVGRIITGWIGLAWSVASVFVIPVLIREESTANPINILAKSGGTIKRTWGEMLTGYIGLKGANGIVFMLSLLPLGVSIAAAVVLTNYWLLIPAGLIWLLAILVYSYLAHVASQVYLCALYIYASEGVVPEPYDQDLLDQAWKVKKSP
jgi:hypothetical protein